MPKFNCPKCLMPLTPYYILDHELDDEAPRTIKAGLIESLARCQRCKTTFLLNTETTVYELPKPGVKKT